MDFSKIFKDGGKLEMAWKKFGRKKLVSITWHEETGYSYVHIKDCSKRPRKHVTVGVDEFLSLIEMRRNILDLEHQFKEENDALTDEEEEEEEDVQLPDLSDDECSSEKAGPSRNATFEEEKDRGKKRKSANGSKRQRAATKRFKL